MKGIPAEVQRDLILSVGVQKGDRSLSPIEVARVLDNAVRAGSTCRELASEILLDASMINRFRRLLTLSPDMQHLVGWRGTSKLSFSAASEIARLSSSSDQQEVAKTALEHGLSKGEIIQVVEMRNRLDKPIEQCIGEVLDMRPRVSRKYLFIGAVTSPKLENRLSDMSQLSRDQLLRKAVSSHGPELPPWGGSLGVNRFTLIGGEALHESISSWPTDFESNVNAFLESELSQK